MIYRHDYEVTGPWSEKPDDIEIFDTEETMVDYVMASNIAIADVVRRV